MVGDLIPIPLQRVTIHLSVLLSVLLLSLYDLSLMS